MNDQIDPTMFTLSSSAAGEQWYSHAMEGLVEVVQDLSLARDLATVMEIVRRAARALTGADGATFVLRDGDQCYYAAEDAISPLWLGRRFPMSICISGWVMRNKQPAVIEDVFADSRIPTEAYRPTFVRSLAMVPIRTRDPVGAIGNYWATQYQPDPHQVKVLQALADTTAVALENVRGYGALEEKIKDMAVLTQAAPVPILTLDPEGAVQSWNPAAERLFGFSAAQSLGCPLSGFDAESANDLKRILNNIRAGREVRGDVLKGQQATGAPIDLRVSGAPVPGENGALRAILLVVVDETERNRLERQFLQSQKRRRSASLPGEFPMISITFWAF